MNYCEMELTGMTSDPCGEPAGIKVDGQWFCAFHADALERFYERTSRPDWIAEQRRRLEEQDEPWDDNVGEASDV